LKSELSTKIIGGRFKGKKIKLPSKEITRSSKNILRESLFNTLQYEIMDENFVEVFGGSGSVGLEALSRGAAHVYFIERDKQAYNTLLSNIRSLDPDRCTLYFGDAFEQLEDIVNVLKRKGEKAYFYFDPPFNIREGMEDIYQKVFAVIEKIPAQIVNMIVIEHLSKEKMPQKIGDFELKKSRKFGKSSLSYYKESR